MGHEAWLVGRWAMGDGPRTPPSRIVAPDWLALRLPRKQVLGVIDALCDLRDALVHALEGIEPALHTVDQLIGRLHAATLAAEQNNGDPDAAENDAVKERPEQRVT